MNQSNWCMYLGDVKHAGKPFDAWDCCVCRGPTVLKSRSHHVPTFKVTWWLDLLPELLKEKPVTSIRSALSLLVISDLGLWSHTETCKINETDRFPGLASPSFPSCYLTWAGATLKIKERHFALFYTIFFSLSGRAVEGWSLFLFRQGNDWFSAHCSRNISFREK